MPDAPDTLFNLPPEALAPIIASAVGEAVGSFSIIGRKTLEGFQGYAAEKILPIIGYTTTAGRSGQVTLFAKRMYGLNIAEEHQYRFFAEHHIPIPRLHGVAFGTIQEEILVLELLEATGIDEQDPGEVRSYIGLLARINAIRIRHEDSWRPPAHLAAADLASGSFVLPALEHIRMKALAGQLGVELQEHCAGLGQSFATLAAKSVDYGRRLQHLPRAIIHEDYKPANTGWRKGRSELVVFDLHRVSYGPRFWDIAGVLGPPSKPSFSCIPWQELAEHYFEQLVLHGGTGGTPAVLLEEAELIRRCAMFDSIRWKLGWAESGQADWTTDHELGLRTNRNMLLTTLQELAGY